MLSFYFNEKTKTKEFGENIEQIFNELNGKKVIIYGAGEGFKELNKIYDFKSKFDIVALADKRFEEKNKFKKISMIKEFKDFNIITPNEVKNTECDYILVSNENYMPIVRYLKTKLMIEANKIKTVFEETIKDERVNLLYLNEFKFGKTLPKLIKKCKNKTVVLYGAGSFLELIKQYYDISALNVIAISDKRFCDSAVSECLGYKACTPNEIANLKPDIVLVATKYYIGIIEDLLYDTLENTDITVKPLVKKPLFTLLKEIWV